MRGAWSRTTGELPYATSRFRLRLPLFSMKTVLYAFTRGGNLFIRNGAFEIVDKTQIFGADPNLKVYSSYEKYPIVKLSPFFHVSSAYNPVPLIHI